MIEPQPPTEQVDVDTPEDLAHDRAHVFATLKTDINGFLWTHLPPGITLGQAEEIAVRWHDEVMRLWGDQAS